MIVESRAPTRIDLSGGTLDIWPLYLFHTNPMTINMAINLYAEVRIETRDDDKITIKSLDLEIEIQVPNINALPEHNNFEIFREVINFFKPKNGLKITSNCHAPAGSGLGGSSALMIALLGAFNRLLNCKYNPHELITLGKNLEAKIIKSPSGEQDFYSALYGGLNCLHLNADGITVKQININYEELENRLVLCYSGVPRLSGITNWNILKMHLDGDKQIFDIFEKLSEISMSMHKALISKDFPKIGELFREEWNTRGKLPGKISSEKIKTLKKIALKGGASSAKICGAGGGGCLLFWIEPEAKSDVIKCLTDAGAHVLDFKISSSGLEIKEL